MLRCLFRRRPTTYRTPDNTRIYAIGDVHGSIKCLDALHQLVLADSAQAKPGTDQIVVYLGDYIDRGLYSREVIDCLIGSPLPGLRPVLLKGNHEEAMLAFFEDPEGGRPWLSFGGLTTLHSYGVPPPKPPFKSEDLVFAKTLLDKCFPEAHRRFLSALEISASIGDYLFVHAGIRPRRPLHQQRTEDMLRIRADFVDSTADHGKVVVHGHTVSPEVEIRPNRIGVDTGAYATGRLSCVVLEGETVRPLSVHVRGG